TLDISQSTEFFEQRWKKTPRVIARLAHEGHRSRGNNNGNALSFSERSERPCRYCATNERDEFPPPHAVSSPASRQCILTAQITRVAGRWVSQDTLVEPLPHVGLGSTCD